MAIFRIEKTQNYTVMSNHHLRNESLSLKAKGLLSQMLSLPENWDYTLKGLSLINRESIDAIRTAVLELEGAGYITRARERRENGQLGGAEYVIHERPQQPEHEFTAQEGPALENPTQVFSILENPTQLNKEEVIIEKRNTDLSNTDQSIYPCADWRGPPDGAIDRIDAMDSKSKTEIYRNIIRCNIGYYDLCRSCDPERVEEIAELILETATTRRRTVRIGGDDLPAETVKSRFMDLERSHIEYVFDCFDKNTTKVRNIKAYLLTALYNAPATIGHYYTAEVNHDFYGCKPGTEVFA